MRKAVILIFILVFSQQLDAQLNGVFEAGEWYKIGVLKSGVYQLDYAYLLENGIDLKGVSGGSIEIYSNGGGGVLPQNVSAPRRELQENAIYVSATDSEPFGEDDYILFFGNSPHFISYNEFIDRFSYEENYYSDTTFYFLRVDGSDGKRITESTPVGTPTPIDQVLNFSYYDVNSFNLLSSGREWFGANFDRPGRKQSVTIQTPVFSEDATQLIEVSAIASSLEASELSINNGGVKIGELSFQGRGSFDNSTLAYKSQTALNVGHLEENGKMELNFTYNSISSRAYAFLDRVLITTRTSLIYTAGEYQFLVPAQNELNQISIEGNFANLSLWDITTPVLPLEVKIGSQGKFLTETSESRNFILFGENDFRTPVKITPLSNQDLSKVSPAELLIITTHQFQSEATRLASHRIGQGIATSVVQVDKIYNEFASGMQDITAIRDYIHTQWQSGSLKYVLLLGDASFDYKNRIQDNTNLVPTYQSRLSLNEVFTYASDDYYGFMEDDEGDWAESSSGIHSLDLGVGRIPAKSVEQARKMVDKLIYYDNELDMGSWRTELLFSADDGDEGLHMRDADIVADGLDTTAFLLDKLYLDEYPQNSGSSPLSEAAFKRKVHEGILVANYVGHGNQEQLAAEYLVTGSNMEKWSNLNRLPFFLTATCDFGNFDNPVWISAGEKLLFNESGGGIGVITATRPVYSNTNLILNKNFNQELSKSVASGIAPIGEIFKVMKNKSYQGVSNRGYVLLTDPSLTLAYPKNTIRIDTIRNASGEVISELISYEEIVIEGSVNTPDGSKIEDFKGEVELTILDGPISKTTLGTDNDPFEFNERSSILHKGRATVENGTFSLQLRLPETVSNLAENLKIIMYASKNDSKVDARGKKVMLNQVGGSRVTDVTPPEIEIFVGDTLFKSGDIVAVSSQLLIRLKDESGIDLRNLDPDNTLLGALNESNLLLNRYYKTEKNTYKTGWVNYDFQGLAPGKYTFTLVASDIYGNTSTKMVSFKVTQPTKLPINDFKVYPNPSHYEDQIFSFKHDRPNESLSFQLDIFSVDGKPIKTSAFYLENVPAIVNTIGWSEEEMIHSGIKSGIYYFTMTITAVSDGAKVTKKGRLVIL